MTLFDHMLKVFKKIFNEFLSSKINVGWYFFYYFQTQCSRAKLHLILDQFKKMHFSIAVVLCPDAVVLPVVVAAASCPHLPRQAQRLFPLTLNRFWAQKLVMEQVQAWLGIRYRWVVQGIAAAGQHASVKTSDQFILRNLWMLLCCTWRRCDLK